MLRSLLIVWMLAAAPLTQVRAVMHCQMAGEVDEPAECCCHGESAQAPAPAEPPDNCCQVTLADSGLPDGVLIASSSDEGHEADPATGPPPIPIGLPTGSAGPPPELRPRPVAGSASPVWLDTRRLRL